MLTKANVIDALKELGLKEGDICLFHSSYKSLGEIEGGAETVIQNVNKLFAVYRNYSVAFLQSYFLAD